MCIVGYYEESTELTIEEQKEELELLSHYHIESYWDWGDAMWVWTQEEYDALTEHNHWTLYVVRDN